VLICCASKLTRTVNYVWKSGEGATCTQLTKRRHPVDATPTWLPMSTKGLGSSLLDMHCAPTSEVTANQMTASPDLEGGDLRAAGANRLARFERRYCTHPSMPHFPCPSSRLLTTTYSVRQDLPDNTSICLSHTYCSFLSHLSHPGEDAPILRATGGHSVRLGSTGSGRLTIL
jgi:hypothetical protein